MDQPQYTTLLEVLAVIPAPAKREANAMPGRSCSPCPLQDWQAASRPSTIAQGVHLHADTLRAALPILTTLPGEATLLRTVRQTDAGIFEIGAGSIVGIR